MFLQAKLAVFKVEFDAGNPSGELARKQAIARHELAGHAQSFGLLGADHLPG